MLVLNTKYTECYYEDKRCNGYFHAGYQGKKMFAKCVKKVVSLHKVNFDSRDEKIVKSNRIFCRCERGLFWYNFL